MALDDITWNLCIFDYIDCMLQNYSENPCKLQTWSLPTSEFHFISWDSMLFISKSQFMNVLPTVLLCFLLLTQIWNSHFLSGRKCTTILHLCWYVNVLNANLPTIFHYKICLHTNIIYKYVLKLSWWQISAKSTCVNSHVKLFKSTNFQTAGIQGVSRL